MGLLLGMGYGSGESEISKGQECTERAETGL